MAFDFKSMGSSPVLGVGLGVLGAGAKTYQGNQAAKASQDPMSLYQGSQGQVGYLSDPRHLQGAGQAMTAHGMTPLGASVIGNSMVNSGATLTSQQAKNLNPEVKKRYQQQGAVAPSMMQNMMNPQMLMSLLQLFGGGAGGSDTQDQPDPTQGGA